MAGARVLARTTLNTQPALEAANENCDQKFVDLALCKESRVNIISTIFTSDLSFPLPRPSALINLFEVLHENFWRKVFQFGWLFHSFRSKMISHPALSCLYLLLLLITSLLSLVPWTCSPPLLSLRPPILLDLALQTAPLVSWSHIVKSVILFLIKRD